jgi:hypothetical protein
MKQELKSAYSRDIIKRIKAAAQKQVPGCLSVCHIFPRAYCVAKPAPSCAIFVIPWQDAEKQVRKPEYSSSESVYQNVKNVQVGDWRAIAYVSTVTSGQTYVIDLP